MVDSVARCGAAVKRAIRPGYVDGDGFKEGRLIAGYDRRTAAALLGVTARTVANWENRRVRVPYSAFKLMRILSGYALPGDAWAGWCVRGDTLWSPEQRAFRPYELAWWGLTVSMARAWRRMYEASSQAQRDASSGVAVQLTITAADVAPGGVLAEDRRPSPHGGEAQGGGVVAGVVSPASVRPSQTAVAGSQRVSARSDLESERAAGPGSEATRPGCPLLTCVSDT